LFHRSEYCWVVAIAASSLGPPPVPTPLPLPLPPSPSPSSYLPLPLPCALPLSSPIQLAVIPGKGEAARLGSALTTKSGEYGNSSGSVGPSNAKRRYAVPFQRIPIPWQKSFALPVLSAFTAFVYGVSCTHKYGFFIFYAKQKYYTPPFCFLPISEQPCVRCHSNGTAIWTARWRAGSAARLAKEKAGNSKLKRK